MNFLKIFSDSFQDNWYSPALTDLDTGLTLEYGILAARIARIHCLMDDLEIPSSAKIAISADNSVDGATVFMAVITSGRTAVVIPPLYSLEEGISFAGMVECEYLFADESAWSDDIDTEAAPQLKLAIAMDGTKILYEGLGSPENSHHKVAQLDFRFIEKYPQGFHPEHAISPNILPETIIAIFFTAGTTGTPKAVMLSADSLEANTIYGIKKEIHPRGSNTLLAVPLGDALGCVFDLMVSLASGAHVFSTNKTLTPSEMIKAIGKARPYKIILSPRQVHGLFHRVQLRLEHSPLWKMMKRMSLLNSLYQMRLRHNFNKMMGGKCVEIIVGASAMSPHLEWSLRRCKIRFTAVYGLAECGGIVTYSPAADWRSGTVGQLASNLMHCRIVPAEIPGLPEGAGELQIRGMTVMKGYYGEDELTRMVMGKDGWFSTGDIAEITENGIITILGRKECVIQTPHGTVFPGKLELMLITQESIRSAIVIDRDGRLTAIIEPDRLYLERCGIPVEDAMQVVSHAVHEVNRLSSLKEHIDDIEISQEPLLLTAKGTVRRYEYF